jgi:NNMT/PNMT/TEMT family
LGNRVSFEEFVPRDYLRDFYSEVQDDERHTIRFFVEQMRTAPRGPILCYGCGPTLHHAFLTVPYATELYLADYLPRNLQEVDDWRRDIASAHDWTAFVAYTLFCETGVVPEANAISGRMKSLRGSISGLLETDAGMSDPLGNEFRGKFATVLSPYCADSATDDKAVWARYSRNIASLVRPGGVMLTSALRRCRLYKIGTRFFPAADIDESDLRAVLEEDFIPESVEVDVRVVPEHRDQGYEGILLARARKAF